MLGLLEGGEGTGGLERCSHTLDAQERSADIYIYIYIYTNSVYTRVYIHMYIYVYVHYMCIYMCDAYNTQSQY